MCSSYSSNVASVHHNTHSPLLSYQTLFVQPLLLLQRLCHVIISLAAAIAPRQAQISTAKWYSVSFMLSTSSISNTSGSKLPNCNATQRLDCRWALFRAINRLWRVWLDCRWALFRAINRLWRVWQWSPCKVLPVGPSTLNEIHYWRKMPKKERAKSPKSPLSPKPSDQTGTPLGVSWLRLWCELIE